MLRDEKLETALIPFIDQWIPELKGEENKRIIQAMSCISWMVKNIKLVDKHTEDSKKLENFYRNILRGLIYSLLAYLQENYDKYSAIYNGLYSVIKFNCYDKNIPQQIKLGNEALKFLKHSLTNKNSNTQFYANGFNDYIEAFNFLTTLLFASQEFKFIDPAMYSPQIESDLNLSIVSLTNQASADLSSHEIEETIQQAEEPLRRQDLSECGIQLAQNITNIILTSPYLSREEVQELYNELNTQPTNPLQQSQILPTRKTIVDSEKPGSDMTASLILPRHSSESLTRTTLADAEMTASVSKEFVSNPLTTSLHELPNSNGNQIVSEFNSTETHHSLLSSQILESETQELPLQESQILSSSTNRIEQENSLLKSQILEHSNSIQTSQIFSSNDALLSDPRINEPLAAVTSSLIASGMLADNYSKQDLPTSKSSTRLDTSINELPSLEKAPLLETHEQAPISKRSQKKEQHRPQKNHLSYTMFSSPAKQLDSGSKVKQQANQSSALKRVPDNSQQGALNVSQSRVTSILPLLQALESELDGIEASRRRAMEAEARDEKNTIKTIEEFIDIADKGEGEDDYLQLAKTTTGWLEAFSLAYCKLYQEETSSLSFKSLTRSAFKTLVGDRANSRMYNLISTRLLTEEYVINAVENNIDANADPNGYTIRALISTMQDYKQGKINLTERSTNAVTTYNISRNPATHFAQPREVPPNSTRNSLHAPSSPSLLG